jgi:uncharacterized protein (TIGR03067 family)
MVSGVFDGVPMDAAHAAWARRITSGDETTVKAGPRVLFKFRFTYDAGASPGRLDYENLAGPNAGEAQHGIFEIVDGLLRVCVAAPGRPRPDVFASAPGDGRSFTEWRRTS